MKSFELVLFLWATCTSSEIHDIHGRFTWFVILAFVIVGSIIVRSYCNTYYMSQSNISPYSTLMSAYSMLDILQRFSRSSYTYNQWYSKRSKYFKPLMD